jgi:hypothetical protein
MTSGKWPIAWRIFNDARELPPAQQRLFVESESTDPEVADQVFKLLEALTEEESQEPESFLPAAREHRSGAIACEWKQITADPPTARPGRPGARDFA